MPKIAGITVERTSKGIPRYVRIDLSKHRDIIPLLVEKGLIDEPEIYNKKFVNKILNAESEPTIHVDLKKYGIKI